MGGEEHRRRGPKRVDCWVITVSDTRTAENDLGGRGIVEEIQGAGHVVRARTLVPDDPTRIAAAVREALADEGPGAIILTGGTGISPRDVTPDVARRFFDRELEGFGELFRFLSFQEIGTAAMLSRAVAGVARGKVIFCLPGAPEAARFGLVRVILPELGHVVGEITRGA